MMKLTAADGHEFQTFEAGNVNAPRGLVVVQEIFGVNDHIKDMAEQFAAAGYKAIAPALFDRAERGVDLGYGPDDRKKGFGLRGECSDADSLADITAAAKALGTASTGVVGYCWGGTIAWGGATRSEAFEAAVGWYGGGIAATKDEMPHCPVQLHFGAEDHGIALTDVDAIRAAQPGVEVYVYEGAGHGFGCEQRGSFDQKSFALAQNRSLDFFRKHLA